LSQKIVRVDNVPTRLRHAPTIRDHQSLIKKPRKWLAEAHKAKVSQRLDEESSIEQVHRGVLWSTDVQIDRHPVRGQFWIERRGGGMRAAIPQKVPRRIDERVHRVALAGRRLPAFGTGCVEECL